MIHITSTSDISQHLKSAGFEACYQITERKPERNSMRNRDASKGKGTLKKSFGITWMCINPSGHKMWEERVVWVLYK